MATKVGLGSFNNFGHIPSGLVAFQFINNLFFFLFTTVLYRWIVTYYSPFFKYPSVVLAQKFLIRCNFL